MRKPGEWPKSVTVRWSMYGCSTGCDGFECVNDDTGDRMVFEFAWPENEAEAREEFEIPDDVHVTYKPHGDWS
jgi:hypothetical protein